eukprot:Hpha_TRINITY_DN16654_c0_g10::TRINITY_DN16654_c0_g10_i3::g.183252::m.183252/K03320/amt, AMT, MEP; ammonium transporter, Amt family
MAKRMIAVLGLLGLAASQVPGDATVADWGTKACSNTADTGCCCATGMRNNGASSCTDTEKILCLTVSKISEKDATCSTKFDDLRADGTQIWILLCGALVVFMQCGFAMLEAGSVRQRNTQNIIFKNMIDACLAAVFFYGFGYAFAYGESSDHFIGASNFFLHKEADDESGMAGYFFQFAFAATASTIVSGAVAERTKVTAYFIYATVLTGFIYPVVVHWVWSNDGWLSAFAPPNVRLGPNGMIDFAGSGVVHAVGGFAGLMGTIVLGPRVNRFEETDEERERLEDEYMQEEEEGCCVAKNHRGWCRMGMYGEPVDMPGQSMMLAALGVLILWFGWYGFNCGSTLAFDGKNAGKVATTTTLAAAAAGLTAVLINRVLKGVWAVEHGLNGVLGGLVSITAGCVVLHEWSSIIVGFVGGAVYYGAAHLLLWLRIDDPLSAWPVHGACGVWGVIAVGIFAQGENIERGYSGLDTAAVSSGAQLYTQTAGIVSIVVWTVCTTLPLFYIIDKTVGMRVAYRDEDKGLDAVDHGMDPTISFQVRHEARVEAFEQKKQEADDKEPKIEEE